MIRASDRLRAWRAHERRCPRCALRHETEPDGRRLGDICPTGYRLLRELCADEGAAAEAILSDHLVGAKT